MFRVISDVIEYDREPFAVIVPSVRASLRDAATMALDDYEPPEDDDADEPPTAQDIVNGAVETWREALYEACEDKATHGLVKLSDIEAIVNAFNFTPESCPQ